MWLSQLFIENPINFEKRCRSRIITGILFALLGAAALGMAFISKSHVFVLYLEPGYREYIPGFYGGTGVGLRCWAYTGYTVMILLYIGILVSGFISLTVSRTLMAVIACYGVILVIFRRMLQKAM